MDDFTRQYIITALWSSDESHEGDREGVPLDKNYGPEDLAPETLEKMQADCADFQEKHHAMISADLERAGHDFWLTRNGHGAGFWDGDWPEHGNALTKASKTYGECDLYVGDDELIYI